ERFVLISSSSLAPAAASTRARKPPCGYRILSAEDRLGCGAVASAATPARSPVPAARPARRATGVGGWRVGGLDRAPAPPRSTPESGTRSAPPDGRDTTTKGDEMKIVVIGGTGLIGSKLVTKLREAGHEAVAASPDTGVNTITGEGLAEAVEGADVV